jgi:hypothetical protein
MLLCPGPSTPLGMALISVMMVHFLYVTSIKQDAKTNNYKFTIKYLLTFFFVDVYLLILQH